ncbi:MAG: 16S rRNA (cytidine(1402)-2'-O)-methyltransferase [Parcubacteria group bacterium]|nr:16S rRNA (cytidine(1402)-2'-O)-methyltransferase [Parcubacteria group bacterium]
MLGVLYIVATPIGNLKDITLRALEILRNVDVILAEDTRVTRKLLNHYEISKPVFSYREHSSDAAYRHIAETLKGGKNVALVSDAGTPAISDPGSRLVAYLRSELPGVAISPLPGPSALVAALSVSGLDASSFTFLGYPPHKKGREKFFKQLAGLKVWPAVLYESPHRFQKTVAQLCNALTPKHSIVVSRELTKIHEEVWSGTLEAASRYFQGDHLKGEFVVIIPEHEDN